MSLKVGDKVVLINNGHLNQSLVGKTGVITHELMNREVYDPGVYGIITDHDGKAFTIVGNCVQLIEPTIPGDDPEYTKRVEYWKKKLNAKGR
jgi:hypothetical protein